MFLFFSVALIFMQKEKKQKKLNFFLNDKNQVEIHILSLESLGGFWGNKRIQTINNSGPVVK